MTYMVGSSDKYVKERRAQQYTKPAAQYTLVSIRGRNSICQRRDSGARLAEIGQTICVTRARMLSPYKYAVSRACRKMPMFEGMGLSTRRIMVWHTSMYHKAAYMSLIGVSLCVCSRGNKLTIATALRSWNVRQSEYLRCAMRLNGSAAMRIAFSCTCHPMAKDVIAQRVTQ